MQRDDDEQQIPQDRVSGFRPGDTANMTDAELDATANQADPDDLGGTGDDPGLTAGGTGTAINDEGAG